MAILGSSRNWLVGLGLVVQGTLWACSDYDCSSPLKVQFSKSEICLAAGAVLLNPGNDTRVNLSLLLEDKGLTELSLKPEDPSEHGYPVPFYLRDLKDSLTLAPVVSQAAWQQQLQQLGIADDLSRSSWELFDSWQDGHCVSNRLPSAWAFIMAVSQTATLPTADKRWLVEERLKMANICTAELGQEDESSPVYQSDLAQDFAQYLAAASAFYLADFATAETGFRSLSQSQNRWLAETAQYMLVRVFLNQAQVNAVDEVGFFDPAKVVVEPVHKAQEQLDRYLKEYPEGRYAASARGLYRKVYWFLGDSAQLAVSLAQRLQRQGTKLSMAELRELLNEIDDKYLFGVGKGSSPVSDNNLPWFSPELASTVVLVRMRKADSDYDEPKLVPVTTAVLEAQKERFTQAGQQELFDYLKLAQWFFVAHQPQQVLAATENATIPEHLTNLSLSRLSLRALAFEQQQDWSKASDLWLALLAQAKRPLHKVQLELALALNWEYSGHPERIFASDSPIKAWELRQPIIKHSANAKLLKQLLAQPGLAKAEQATALFSLLYKQLIHGQYAELQASLAAYPLADYPAQAGLASFAWAGQAEPNYPCPSLLNTVALLVAQADHPQAHNCIAEFVLRNEGELQLGTKPGKLSLGGSSDGFSGPVLGRLDWYLPLINQEKTPAADKAYALYRAINCFANSGNNQCGNQSIAPEQRKAWFRQLKSKFAASTWAQSQKYYW